MATDQDFDFEEILVDAGNRTRQVAAQMSNDPSSQLRFFLKLQKSLADERPSPPRRLWWRVLAAVCASFLCALLIGAYGGYRFGFDAAIRQVQHELKDSVVFSMQRPFLIAEDEVVSAGRAKASVYSAVKFTAEPALPGGKNTWTKKLGTGTDDENIVPFEFRVRNPRDGQLRKFTIEFVPHEAAKGVVRTAHESVSMICDRFAFINAKHGPPVTLTIPDPIKLEGGSNRLSGVSHRTGYLVVLLRSRDAENQPWFIQNRGDYLRVTAGKEFEIECEFGPDAKHFDIVATVADSKGASPFLKKRKDGQPVVRLRDIPDVDSQGKALVYTKRRTITVDRQ